MGRTVSRSSSGASASEASVDGARQELGWDQPRLSQGKESCFHGLDRDADQGTLESGGYAAKGGS